MDFEIRKVRKAQGPVKLRREREEYFRLVQMGLTNREASRQVGVHERTGREWRNGRTTRSGGGLLLCRSRSPSLRPRGTCGKTNAST
ncbi:hypothetical protein GCM10010251_38860 [Streptomyces aurantiogriseus]|uniref:Uncharacterized protein n=1 Tax=Streptomyces aurantiogriseus TaxID=66870 RepID=A0A918CDL3_9ACTN|nr:hypothetical protein GCM10010251_38860 [Streptomyces aurantiogriseus]